MVDAVLIGQILQEYRVKKGMSQELLSGLAGLDRTHYSKIERGLRSPTLDTLFKIAQALEIPPHEIGPDDRRQNGRRGQVIRVIISQRAGVEPRHSTHISYSAV